MTTFTSQPQKQAGWRAFIYRAIPKDKADRRTLKRRHMKVSKRRNERRIAGRQAPVISGPKRTEELITRERDKAQQYLDLVPVIMVALDADGRVTLLNKKGCEVLGCSLEQALGKNWFDNFVPRPARDSVRDVFRSLMTGEREAASFEYDANLILTRRGEERSIAWHNTLLRDDQGAIVGTLSAGNDITETKRLESELRKEEETWRTYVEYAADLIFTTDDTGRLTSVNRAVCETTGYNAQELIGSNPLDIIPPGRQAAAETALRRMLKGEKVHRVEFEVLSKDGRLIALEVRGRALYEGDRVVGTFQIARDVTERKHMEEELRHYSAHLEEMVRERTEKLQDAERLATIGEMAAMVGHDLRNPLTGIAAATHLLKMRLDPTGDHTAREAIRIIERSIEYSNKIIGELMEYSGEMRLQPTVTDPKFLTRAAVSLVTIPENIRILDETRSEPRMTVHVERIVRVFTNLIRNAVEAMPQGGTLRIASRTTDGWVEFDFADTGAGMTPETIEKLWTPLFTTKARGMGLGLAVSKRIVEAHGGSVSAESIFGKGSTFRVKLPIQPDLWEVEKARANMPEFSSSMTTRT